MVQISLEHLPSLPGVKHQLKKLLEFLGDSSIGLCVVSYECPTTKAYIHINVERKEREPGTYYREDYPVFFWVDLHNSPCFPQVRVQLTFEDRTLLRSKILKLL